MSDTRTCVVCQRDGRIPNRPPVCDGCRQALDSMLREIPDLFAQLDPRPATGGAEKVSGSRVPPVPLNLDVADLSAEARLGSVGIRTVGEWATLGGDPDQIGYLAVATELDFWVRDWREAMWPDHCLPLPTVGVLAVWLTNRLERACDEHPAIDEFAAKVRQIHRALTRHVGEVKATGERVGRCPMILRGDTRCATTLRVDPYVSQVACPRCRTSWPTWLHLMAAMEDAEDGESEAA